MRSVAVIILHAYIALAPAKELATNANSFQDDLIDKLMGRVISTPNQYADLDETTFAKAHPGSTITNVYQPMTFRSASSQPQVRVEAIGSRFMPPVSAGSPLTRSRPMPQLGGMMNPVQSLQPTLTLFPSLVGLEEEELEGVPRDVSAATAMGRKGTGSLRVLRRASGYWARMRTHNGQRVMKNRRAKGRHRLIPGQIAKKWR